MSDTRYVILKETGWQSVASDAFTFGVLYGGFYLNYAYMGQSTFINVILVVMTLIAILGKALNKPKLTAAEAIEEIKRLDVGTRGWQL